MEKKISRDKVEKILSMTDTQLGIFFHCLKSNDIDMYTIKTKVEIEGELDVERFKESIKILIEENEALRSTFRWEDITKPVCIIQKLGEIPFEVHDYFILNSTNLFDKGISLDGDSLIKFILLKKESNEYTLIIQCHHIIMDGWSLGNLMDSLFKNYENIQNKEYKRKCEFNYSNYIEEVKKVSSKDDEIYWKEYLRSFDNKLELDIRTEKNIAENKKSKCKYTFNMDEEDKLKLNNFLTQKGILLSSFIYSVWALVLHKYTAEEDILFGSVASGRNISVPGIMEAIGYFSNTIPCRAKIDRNKSFIDFLKDVNEDQIQVTQHNLTPLYKIKKYADLNIGSDLFSTLVVVENYPIPKINGELDIKSIEVDEQNNFSIVLGVMKGEDISFELEYDTNKYNLESMINLSNHIKNVIHDVINDNEILIRDINILSDKDKEKLLCDFNCTEVDFSRETTIGELFAKQVKETPDLDAVKFGDEKITYKELDELSSVLANKILEKGINNNDIACIVMDISINAIMSMIAVMKSGAAFLPLDRKYPKDRIHYIMNSNNSKCIITTREVCSELDLNTENCIFVDEINIDDAKQVKYSGSKDLAYLIATSGTTGKPKSIMIKNESFTDFVLWAKEEYAYKIGSQGLLSLSFAFDSALLQIFPPLISGGTLHLIDPDKRKNPEFYFNFLKDNKINVIDEMPTIMNILFQYIEQDGLYKGENLLPELSCISLGSEYVPVEIGIGCKKYFNKNGKVINAYGPAEASVVATTYHFDEEKNHKKFLIGKPRNNTKVYILNKNGELCPIGVPGELCISGICVAKGYNDIEKTKEKFIKNTFSNNDDYKVIYKTGDMACWYEEGNIDFLGRIDNQIKFHGYRVEVEEIEKHLQSIVEDKNVVIVDKVINDSMQLVAYIETNSNQIDIYEIKKKLRKRVPSYMVPGRFFEIDELPKNDNGKIDRNKLRERKDTNNETTSFKVNGKNIDDKLHMKIRGIWKKILGHENFDDTDNFYEIGGDSITVVNMYMMLKKEFKDIEINMSDLFSYTTIREIYDYYKTKITESGNQESTSDFNEEGNDVVDDIAIVGIAARLPKAKNIFEYWNNLARGVNCIDNISEDRKELDFKGYKNKEYSKWGFMEDVDKFDPLFFKISPGIANNMDPNHRKMMEVSYLALEDGGYFRSENSDKNVGVFMGANLPTYVNYITDATVDELLSTNLPSNIAGRVSYHMGLTGPTVTIDTACSSSLTALHYAVSSLRNKECNMAIVGASYIEIEPIEYNLSSGIVSASQKCNTFSDKADGTIGGEGCVAVVLKPLSKAVEDKDYIYSVIKGSAVNHDGDRSNGYTAPNSSSQAECIRKAWKDAKINPETISYIEAHGTGTKLGDPIEIDGITKAFKGINVEKQSIAIGSVKSNIGHLDSAAGLASIVKTSLCLSNKKIVPSLNFSNPNPYINFKDSPVHVVTELTDWKVAEGQVRRAGISGFGLSGTNCHVVLEEYNNLLDKDDERNEGYELVVFSGKCEEGLNNQIQIIYDYLQENQGISLKNLSYTLALTRESYKFKKSFTAMNVEELSKKLKSYLEDKKLDDEKLISLEDLELIRNNIQSEKFRKLENKFEVINELSKLYEKDEKYIWEILSRAYDEGVDIKLDVLIEGRKIPVPSEPFKKESYWIKNYTPSKVCNKEEAFKNSVEVIKNKNIFYDIKWKKSDNTLKDFVSDDFKDKTVLLIRNNESEGYENVIDTINDKFRNVVIVNLGEEFKYDGHNEYEVNSMEEKDYKVVFEKIKEEYSSIDYQIFLLNDDTNIFTSYDIVENNVKKLVLSTLYIFKYLEQYVDANSVNNYFITQRACCVSDDDPIISSYLNIAFAMNRTINQEFKNIKSFIFDVDESVIKSKENIESSVLKEIYSNNEELQVCYRNRERYISSLCNVSYPDYKLVDAVKENGVYVITGGTGGIGLELAKHIADRKRVKLFLVSRSKIEIDSLTDDEFNSLDNRKKNIVNSIKEIRNKGSLVEVLSADVSNYDEMKEVISHIEDKYVSIDGVIHTAGTFGERKSFRDSTWNEFDMIFKPKVYGLMILEKLLRNKFLDFFISFSSVDAYLSKDAVPYSCANAFIDSFTKMNRQLGRKLISVNWGTWRNTGMSQNTEDLNKTSIKENIANLKDISISKIGFNLTEGFSAFDVILSSNLNNVIVTELDDKDIKDIKDTCFYKVDKDIKIKENSKVDTKKITIDNIRENVSEIWKEILELEDIESDESFYEYGGDSISGMEIMLKITEIYQIKLDPSILFEYETVDDLSDYIFKTINEGKNKKKDRFSSISKAKPLS